MTDFDARLSTEFSELAAKLGKLEAFIGTERYAALSDVDRRDLSEQLRYMRAYHKVLLRRVSRLCGAA